MALDCTRFFLLLGQTGSGKTELALNLALWLVKNQNKTVCFIDMDQTKGLFRARDLKDMLLEQGIRFLETIQFQDSPIVPEGVTGAITDPNCICIFDVGGNAVGARMIGQYASLFEPQMTQGLYVINPMRPFSDDQESLLSNMEKILNASRVSMQNVKIISNPCLGDKTTKEDILEGHQHLIKLLRDKEMVPSALVVRKEMENLVKHRVSCPVCPIEIHITPLYKL